MLRFFLEFSNLEVKSFQQLSFSFFGVIKKPGCTLNPVARVPPTLDKNVTIKLSPKTTKTIHWKEKVGRVATWNLLTNEWVFWLSTWNLWDVVVGCMCP